MGNVNQESGRDFDGSEWQTHRALVAYENEFGRTAYSAIFAGERMDKFSHIPTARIIWARAGSAD